MILSMFHHIRHSGLAFSSWLDVAYFLAVGPMRPDSSRFLHHNHQCHLLTQYQSSRYKGCLPPIQHY